MMRQCGGAGTEYPATLVSLGASQVVGHFRKLGHFAHLKASTQLGDVGKNEQGLGH
jgi:hypothetical protein